MGENKHTQAQKQRSIACNPTSDQYWKSRGLEAPPGQERVQKARDLNLEEEQKKK